MPRVKKVKEVPKVELVAKEDLILLTEQNCSNCNKKFQGVLGGLCEACAQV